MSRRNRGVDLASPAGGHTDGPTPEALTAYAPTRVRATAPPMRPNVRGLRFPRSHRSPQYRCALRSALRSASCATPGWKRLLNGRGAPGSGNPENGWLIFLTSAKSWFHLAGRKVELSKDRGIAAGAAVPLRTLGVIHLFPNHIELRYRAPVLPTSGGMRRRPATQSGNVQGDP